MINFPTPPRLGFRHLRRGAGVLRSSLGMATRGCVRGLREGFMRRHKRIALLLAAALLFAAGGAARATVLFSSAAESGACDTGVATSVWNYMESGDTPNSRMFYRCDTPVPGRSKYFRIDTVDRQHDSYNTKAVNQINLTPGVTYYLGAFFRFDRVGGLDIWRDTNQPDSYDKLLEFAGSIRWIILSGWPNAGYPNGADHKFTFDLYSSPTFCTSCGSNEKTANIPPYGRSNPFLCDYGKWYAVVMAYTPSSGGSATNGKVELFINGIKTTSLSQKTQDSSTPNITTFKYTGTTAQPNYDAPAHVRKIDYFIFADSLADVQAAGLMTDPELALSPPKLLRLQ